MSKIKIPKSVKYYPGNIIAGREIIKYIASLGKTHIYKVKCLQCGTEITMSECSITASDKCRVCYRKQTAKKSYSSIRNFRVDL